MNKLKNSHGITLVALIITVIVLFIIAGISIMEGTDLLKHSEAETIETNMYTVRSKAKEYAENVEALNWNEKTNDSDKNENGLSTKETKNRKEFQEEYGLTLIEDGTTYSNSSNWYVDTENYTYYALSQEALNKMDLSDLWTGSEEYVIRYPLEDENIDDLAMDIIFINGVEYEDNIYYTLSELENQL